MSRHFTSFNDHLGHLQEIAIIQRYESRKTILDIEVMENFPIPGGKTLFQKPTAQDEV